MFHRSANNFGEFFPSFVILNYSFGAHFLLQKSEQIQNHPKRNIINWSQPIVWSKIKWTLKFYENFIIMKYHPNNTLAFLTSTPLQKGWECYHLVQLMLSTQVHVVLHVTDPQLLSLHVRERSFDIYGGQRNWRKKFVSDMLSKNFVSDQRFIKNCI